MGTGMTSQEEGAILVATGTTGSSYRYYRPLHLATGTTGPAIDSLPMPPLNSRHRMSKLHPRHRYYRLEATGTTGDAGTASSAPPRPCAYRQSRYYRQAGRYYQRRTVLRDLSGPWPCIPSPLG